VLTSQSLTVDLTASGAGGLDTGSVTAGNGYHLWLIYNPTSNTLAALASASSTAPTLPSGYTVAVRVGSNMAATTTHWLPGNQVGEVFQALPSLPAIASGAQGDPVTPTWVAVAVRGNGHLVPSTAVAIRAMIRAYNNNEAVVLLAPNNGYGGLTSSTNPPPLLYETATVVTGSAIPGELVLESDSVYYAANDASCGAYLLGWVDSLDLGGGGAGVQGPAGPAGSGGGTSTTATITTASIAPGATANVQVDLAKTTLIKVLETDYPAWVRVCATAAARTADASRNVNSYPRSGSGVVADTVTATGALRVLQDPKPIFANDDDPVSVTAYVAITNNDTVGRAITLTVVHIPQEV
jgi:voltage-gated potassium channel Kch